jgi:hypothetical protein
MSSTSAPAPSVVLLARELADGDVDDAFVRDLTGWLAASPRFRAFASDYRPKIRKKVRSATDIETLRDVRAELLAAHRLLADRRFTVVYEAYGSGRSGPDLTVTDRTTAVFNVEVTRLRKAADPEGLAATLVAKLRQLPPSIPNVVLIASERPASAVDIAGAIRALRVRADARDDAFFDRRGLGSARGFYERFLRLGAVLSWCDDAPGDDRAGLWNNPSARISLPERAGRACLACLRETATRR